MTLGALQNWIVQTGLMVSLLILVILFIRRPFARAFGANAAYALWSLPLIRLCLPGLSIPQNWVPEFLRPTPQAPIIGPAVEVPAMTFRPLVDDRDVVIPTQIETPDPIAWGVILIAIWLGVAFLWFTYQLILQARFKSALFARSVSPGGHLSSEIDRAAQQVGLRKPPIVRAAADETGPLVTGVFKPLVIVPQSFSETFNPQQRHFALVHEFAHIKRRDLWAALATLIFRAVNWPNPLVHYASHKMRGDQEAACDAFVVKVTGGKTAHSYAETLVKAVRQESETSGKNPHLALSLTPTNAENSKGNDHEKSA